MEGQTQTLMFLWAIAGLVCLWEIYALWRLPAGSTISSVIGTGLRLWPPLFALLTAIFIFLLWHCYGETR